MMGFTYPYCFMKITPRTPPLAKPSHSHAGLLDGLLAKYCGFSMPIRALLFPPPEQFGAVALNSFFQFLRFQHKSISSRWTFSATYITHMMATIQRNRSAGALPGTVGLPL